MALKKTSEWVFEDDPIVGNAPMKPRAPLATFNSPGLGGSPTNPRQNWKGLSLTASAWNGYQLLSFLTAEKSVMAQLEIHRSIHPQFAAAVEQLKKGLPYTIKLDERAQMDIDGRIQSVKWILLQPRDAKTRMQIIGRGYLDIWSGQVDSDPFVKVLDRTAQLMSQQSEAPPRRALRSPAVSEKTMPATWVAQQARLDAKAARKLEAPVIPLGSTRKVEPLYAPLRTAAPKDAGGYGQRTGSGLRYPLKSVAAEVEGRPVSALELELRLDEWPPLISLEYGRGMDRRYHVVEFTAGDLNEMRRSIDDKVWNLKQTTEMTLALSTSLRGVIYEEIRKAILDFRPGLGANSASVRKPGTETMQTPRDQPASRGEGAEEFRFG